MNLTLEELEGLRNRMTNRLRSMLGTDSEDVVSEVLAVGHQRIQKGQPTTASWIWKLCSWRAKDRLRARIVRGEAPDAELPDRSGPADEYDLGEVGAVWKLLDALVPSQQAIMRPLAAGMSVAEIALLLDLGTDTVKHRIRRARLRLGTSGAALTLRELEVCQLLSEGLEQKQIGRALAISADTVRNHLASVYHKLGVHNAAQAVRTALRNKLIS